MNKYNPFEFEAKWREKWQQEDLYRAQDNSSKEKYYCLDMFPYPSGEGLHVGHWRGYVLSDIWARYQILQGKNVLHPIGWDAFGLPAENAAIKTNTHPSEYTQGAISNIKRQLSEIGAVYDWSREIDTSDPKYYKWTQWLFIKLFEAGLAYQKEALVNWCPSCQTTLANEQVIGGKCERCGSEVTKKKLKQWFFKITDYAQKLLDGLDKIDWPQRVKTLQQNWIGKSNGVLLNFKLEDGETLPIFTTRPDTIYGVTFMVLAPEHALVEKITTQDQKNEVTEYIKQTNKTSEIERTNEKKEKTGVFTGAYVLHPLTGVKLPIWISDFVLSGYGEGAVMSVPAYDERDKAFAQKYDLEIIEAPLEEMEKITRELEEKDVGKKTVNFKLRDWLISRQRYWGAPIPIIHCPNCGAVAAHEKDLPIELPHNIEFKPSGQSPLSLDENFINTTCPNCGESAKRETDTTDTFVCSSWYYLRYADPNNDLEFAAKDKLKYWLPVDFYVGGIEHAILHLLYARFITKVLFDLKYLEFEEPFEKLYNIGMIYLHGAKMSKSKGNVISADELIKKFGTDTVRGYEMFVGPSDLDSEWNPNGIMGVWRFLEKVYNLKIDDSSQHPTLNGLLVDLDEDYRRFSFNTAMSKMMSFINKTNSLNKEEFSQFLITLSPIFPHLAEEMWQNVLGEKESIFKSKWPKNIKEVKIDKIQVVVQINGKVRDRLEVSPVPNKDEVKNLAKTEKINKYLENKAIKKTIVAEMAKNTGYIVNFVV